MAVVYVFVYVTLLLFNLLKGGVRMCVSIIYSIFISVHYKCTFVYTCMWREF
jgi:hypothetical protein